MSLHNSSFPSPLMSVDEDWPCLVSRMGSESSEGTELDSSWADFLLISFFLFPCEPTWPVDEVKALAVLNTDDWVSRFLLGLHSDPFSTPELGEECLFPSVVWEPLPKANGKLHLIEPDLLCNKKPNLGIWISLRGIVITKCL